jgi:hypothetical protein
MNLVLEALEKAGMRINKLKCTFHAKEIEFLGYIMGLNKIKMDPKKVQAVQNWPVPRNVIKIQEFLRFANFYRRFIKDYLKIATPLTNLTRKNRTFA